MFSYRHGFHAGNHADVLKHLIVLQLLDYLGRKDKAFWYIDTHAGAGVYSLRDGFAAQRDEFETGIGRLWDDTPDAAPLRTYVDAVRALNPDGVLRFYPGSPYLAFARLREQDRMRLFELHSSEIELLRANFEGAGRRVMVTERDGFEGLKAVLPPPPRRALTLIDPSYEDKQDYPRAAQAIEDGLRRFANGTYALWYPRVVRPEIASLIASLKQRSDKWLHAVLDVSAAPADRIGLYGSGMFVVNPPYLLEPALRQTLPELVARLGRDAGARFVLEQSPH